MFVYTTLDKIVGKFTKLHAQLDTHVSNLENLITYKQSTVDQLHNEIAQHDTEKARALNIRDNIKKLLDLP